MTISHCKTCPALEVSQWCQGDDWKTSEAYPDDFSVSLQSEHLRSLFPHTRVCVIIAKANKIRNCQRCREALIQCFQMSEAWWSPHYKRSNGYFGCETTHHAGKVTGMNTWAYFEVKRLFANMDYEWDKINVFTRWVASTKQTIVIIFDPKPSIQEGLVKSLLSFDSNTLDDIYWPYPIILDSVANLEEIAVWGIRNQVRDIETKGMPEGAPKPEYRKLHDISRHAIHVSETLDVAVQTVEAIQKHHINLIMPRTDDQYQDPLVSEGIRARLEFYQGFISNLRHRSTSNEKRLQNEIQLAFNTVAQHNAATSVDIGRVALYNAETSVKIGRAAKIDSSAMKTIAFVTLIFLPPTYISSVFSMSFFQCGNDNGWGLSNKFWIYWVFAIPTTIATVIVWQYWHNLFPDPESNKPKNAV